MRRGILFVVAVAASAAAAAAWACSDPVHDSRVDALGPETTGVSPGPTHRPGQPCLTCHGGSGPAGTEFSVAGTIFQTAFKPATAAVPAAGSTVAIFDATQQADGGAPHTFKTNSAGNFFATRDSWSPIYPLHDISVTTDGLAAPTPMQTNVGRDGECSFCHFDPSGAGSHGHVYLVADPADLPGAAPTP